jgi:hypothetical protein
VEPPSVEDSPESSAEQEQASSSANKNRVSGTAAPPPVRDDGSLDYDGILFYSLLYTCARRKLDKILCKICDSEIPWK